MKVGKQVQGHRLECLRMGINEDKAGHWGTFKGRQEFQQWAQEELEHTDRPLLAGSGRKKADRWESPAL